MNHKFSIGVVIAIVLQISGFVWWIAQQSQTIDTLKGEVAELTAKSEIEKEVTLLNDVKQLRKDLDDLNQKTLEAITTLEQTRISEINRVGTYTDTTVNNLGEYTDSRLQEITDNVIAEFQKHEGWIDELDEDIDAVYDYIDSELKKLKDN